MTPTAEQLLKTIRNLPAAERRRLFEMAEAEHLLSPLANQPENEKNKFQLAMGWIKENRQKYDGQWVALDGDKLLASGTDGKKVHAEAQSRGVDVPFMHRISANETEPSGGW